MKLKGKEENKKQELQSDALNKKKKPFGAEIRFDLITPGLKMYF